MLLLLPFGCVFHVVFATLWLCFSCDGVVCLPNGRNRRRESFLNCERKLPFFFFFFKLFIDNFEIQTNKDKDCPEPNQAATQK